MGDKQHPGPRHEEGQGPAGFQAGGPASGSSLKDLQQPTVAQNSDEVMEQHFDHPKRHTPGHPPK